MVTNLIFSLQSHTAVYEVIYPTEMLLSWSVVPQPGRWVLVLYTLCLRVFWAPLPLCPQSCLWGQTTSETCVRRQSAAGRKHPETPQPATGWGGSIMSIAFSRSHRDCDRQKNGRLDKPVGVGVNILDKVYNVQQAVILLQFLQESPPPPPPFLYHHRAFLYINVWQQREVCLNE